MNEIKNKFMQIKNLSIWVLLGMFVISGLFQGSFFGGNFVIAHVGKIAIKAPEVRGFMNMLASQLPEGIDARANEVQQYLFEQAKILLIKRALLTNECRRLGFVASNEKVIETIKNDKKFFINGRFSRSKFLETLGKIGFSEMEYKKFHKENLLHQQYIFMLNNSFVLPEEINQAIAKAFLQKRDGRYSFVDRSKIVVPKISDRELEKFYNDNLNLFKVPEKKIFKILILNDNVGIEKVRKLLEKQKFDKIEGMKFGAISIMSDAEVEKINALVPEFVLKHFNTLAIDVNKNTQLYTFGKKQYCAKLIQIIPSYTPKFSDIKPSVYKTYAMQYREKNVRATNWISINGISFGSFYLGVPKLVSRAIFVNPIGKIARYDEGDNTYFIMVDKIINLAPNKTQINDAQKGIKEELLHDVLEAALNSLELRYKIRIAE